MITNCINGNDARGIVAKRSPKNVKLVLRVLKEMDVPEFWRSFKNKKLDFLHETF
jgi:hypothetical protein